MLASDLEKASRQDLNPPVDVMMVDRPAPFLADDTDSVRIIDNDDGPMFIRHRDDLRQRSDMPLRWNKRRRPAMAFG